jgi:HEAT repeat protein
MPDRRLVEYHIERLKNKNPEVRLKAINELRLLADPAALEALEQVYNTDEEVEVRKAAQAAGREIFLKSKQQP